MIVIQKNYAIPVYYNGNSDNRSQLSRLHDLLL